MYFSLSLSHTHTHRHACTHTHTHITYSMAYLFFSLCLPQFVSLKDSQFGMDLHLVMVNQMSNLRECPALLQNTVKMDPGLWWSRTPLQLAFMIVTVWQKPNPLSSHLFLLPPFPHLVPICKHFRNSLRHKKKMLCCGIYRLVLPFINYPKRICLKLLGIFLCLK